MKPPTETARGSGLSVSNENRGLVDVKSAARELETDPKTLRTFLRSDPQYKSPGIGGRYDLSAFSVEFLRSQFELWSSVTTARIESTLTEQTQLDELPPLELGASKEAVDAHIAEIDRRLLQRLASLKRTKRIP